jgi:hypothetical protein
VNYTPGQIQTLRERLNAYRLNEVEEGRKKLPWLTISERLAGLTQVEIPDETLRQFVLPTSKKRGVPPRNLGTRERYDAVAAFLSHESIGYLSEHELNEETAPHHAALSLMKFFGCQTDSPSLIKQSALSGTYYAERDTESGSETISLQIDAHGEGGLIRVNEVSELEDFDIKAGEKLDRVECSGWAVLQNEKLLIAFLRDPMTEAVHCYFALSIFPALSVAGKTRDLVLYQYKGAISIPLETETETETDAPDIDGMHDLIVESGLQFQRRF